MLDLRFGPLPVGDVDQCPFEDRPFALGPSDQTHVLEDPDRASVLPAAAELEVDDRPGLPDFGDELRSYSRVRIQLPGVAGADIVARLVAENADESVVAVQQLSVDRRAIHAGEVPFEELPVALLGGAQSFDGSLVLER